MTAIGDRFDISRASVSKICTMFSEMHSLPPSRYCKGEFSRASYSASRIEQIKQSQENHGSNGNSSNGTSDCVT